MNENNEKKRPVRLMPFRPMFFNLVISVGQKGLLKEIILIPYLPIKLLEFSFQPIKMKALYYLDCCHCYVQRRLIWPRVLLAMIDLVCFCEGKLLLERYVLSKTY